MNIPKITFLSVLPVAFFVGFLSLAKQPAKGSHPVTGHVMQRRSYCGGAAPPQDLLDQLAKPLPVSAKKIFVKKGQTNSDAAKILATLVTDSAGTFKIDLAPGDYCFVEESKTRPLEVPADMPGETWNAECLAKQHASCDYSLKVTNKREDITINYLDYCFWNTPCKRSRNPLPPESSNP